MCVAAILCFVVRVDGNSEIFQIGIMIIGLFQLILFNSELGKKKHVLGPNKYIYPSACVKTRLSARPLTAGDRHQLLMTLNRK